MLTQEQKQETVNRVVAFMVKQQEPSHAGDKCLYLHTGTGRQCAIGCMLTREQCIEADDRNYSVRDIAELGWNDWSPGVDQDFLGELQDCHDNAAPSDARSTDTSFIAAFDSRMSRFCEDWKLVHPGGLC